MPLFEVGDLSLDIYIYMHMNFLYMHAFASSSSKVQPSHILALCSDPLGSIGDEICRSRNGRRFKTFPFFCMKPDVGQQTKPWRKTRGSIEGTTRNTRSECSYHLFCKVHFFGGKTFLTISHIYLKLVALSCIFRVSCRGEADKNCPLSNPCDKMAALCGRRCLLNVVRRVPARVAICRPPVYAGWAAQVGLRWVEAMASAVRSY